ncbi:hypothetical protein GE061_011297 [Apolygus lucorum]|uniref:Uncharacterized protein n=1 Tax=Apolygus lucorum TaxID=248454 RepID=A0A8S9XZQ0_APOLU|nr:hypothetical protein GE061_011297 [Apolygus lucorum]
MLTLSERGVRAGQTVARASVESQAGVSVKAAALSGASGAPALSGAWRLPAAFGGQTSENRRRPALLS